MIIVCLLAFLIQHHSTEALSCYSCNGAKCPETAGRCTSQEVDAKCFIRVDPNNMTYWGCVSGSQWHSRVDLDRDGCREDPDMGWLGHPSVWCLCSSGDYCNTDPLNIAIRHSRYLPDAVWARIDTAQKLLKSGKKQTAKSDDVIRKIEYHVQKAKNNVRGFITRSPVIRPVTMNQQGSSDAGFIRRTGAARQGPVYDYNFNEPIPKSPRVQSNRASQPSRASQNSVDNYVHGLYDYLDTRPFIPRIRDCRIHNGYCEQFCVRGWNGMGYCGCEEGYSISDDLMTCQDTNECEQENGGCLHHCVNLAGSYRCQCLDGYHMMPDNKTCYEIDECRQDNGGCAHGCHNLPGSYVCTCPPGYELAWDQHNCTDSDECRFEARCEQLCTNTVGSYTCNCTDGYRLHADGYACVDVDECAEAPSLCDQRCVNTPGSYVCGCLSGYDITADNRTCLDTDECADTNGNCDHFCLNSPGSFRCACAPGFLLLEDGTTCLEVLPGEKCVESNGGCGHNCTDVTHSNHTTVICSCLEGFGLTADNKSCADLDECNPGLLAPKACDHVCVNSLGSYSCLCHEGYDLVDHRNCVDIDECEVANGGCDDICVNTESSYFCACSRGFWLHADKHQCIDIDECQQNNGGCPIHCLNTIGSYNCSCGEGYLSEDDGRSCQDMDECHLGNHGCSQQCVNTAGSYVCICAEGYELTSDNRTCMDIDECRNHKGGCSQKCINMPGSYACGCHTGYKLDYDGQCQDIDECWTQVHTCSTHCVNTPGSYKCACPPGYRVTSDGTGCEDDNECERGNGGCEQKCYNILGSYRCSCAENYGYSLGLDGHSCQVSCPEGFDRIDSGDTCYKFLTSARRNFEDAEELCRSLHPYSHLTTMDSQEGLQHMASYFKDGLTDNHLTWWTSGKYWEPINEFIWITSYNIIPANSTLWGDVQGDPEGTCVTMAANQEMAYKLSNTDCDLLTAFICQIDLPSR